MKYKKGDVVRIKPDISGCIARNVNGEMDKWQGRLMTIRAIEGCGYRMYEDQGEFGGGGWLWLEEMLAGAADEVPSEESDDPDPLHSEIKGLVVEELEREEIRRGFFRNRLEAIATVQQEIWRSEQEIQQFEDSLKAAVFEESFQEKRTIGEAFDGTEYTHGLLLEMRDAAVKAACKLIRVAVMCEKFQGELERGGKL